LPEELKFQSDEEVKPLQAADMIAWLARRYYFDLERGRDPSLDASHKFLANLFLPKHDIFRAWTEDEIKQAAEVMLAARKVRS
jgi:hypothetical protein